MNLIEMPMISLKGVSRSWSLGKYPASYKRYATFDRELGFGSKLGGLMLDMRATCLMLALESSERAYTGRACMLSKLTFYPARPAGFSSFAWIEQKLIKDDLRSTKRVKSNGLNTTWYSCNNILTIGAIDRNIGDCREMGEI